MIGVWLIVDFSLGVAINDIFTNQNIKDACERIEMELGYV